MVHGPNNKPRAGHVGRLLDGLVRRAQGLGFWRLLFFTVILSEILTAIMNTVMSYVWWGEFSLDLLLIGSVDALVVSSLAASVVIYILMRLGHAESEYDKKSVYLDHLLRSSTDLAICATDLDYRIVFFNPAAEEMFGYRADDVIGKSAKDMHISGGASLSRFDEAVEEVKLRGEHRINLEREQPDGKKYVEARVSGIYGRDGVLIGYALLARDVTVRKDAERALRESEERFRNLVEQAADALFVHDLDGRILEVNHYACSMLGYTREELTGLSIQDIEVGVAVPILREFWKNMKPGVPMTVNGVGRRKNGSTFPTQVRVGLFKSGGRMLVQALARDFTERKLMEEALRDSEAKYRKLVEGSLVGVTILQDGEFKYINPRGAEILGYSPEEMTGGLTVADIVHPDDSALVAKNIRARLKGENDSISYSFRAMHKDGHVVHVEVHGSRTEYNGMPAIVSSIIDISDRTRAEEALRESEVMFRGLVEQSLVGVTIIQDEKFAYVNLGYSEITGYSREELTGFDSVFDIINPQDREQASEKLRKRISEEIGPLRSQFRIMKKGGGYVYVEAHGARTMYLGRPALIGIIVDITERRKTEDEIRMLNEGLERRVHERTAELKESERKYRMLMEQASDAILIGDSGGNILAVNSRAYEMLGYSREDLTKMNAADMVMPGQYYDFTEGLAQVLAGKTVIGELELLGRDGRTVPVEVSARMLEDGSLIAIARDITERRHAEEERERMRTRLLEAQKMEAVGTLAGGIAHDFNNLLTVIKGDCSLAMSHVGEGGEVYSSLKQISKAAARAAELTGKLLMFSRKKPMAAEPLDLNLAIEEILKLLRRIIGEDINIEVDLAPGLWTVRADSGSIGQVLMNLAVNARDAMPSGGTLCIRTENVALDESACEAVPDSRPGMFVRLSVSDTGEGMDEETLRHIFEPFFSRKGISKGTGLGLSVVYGIVEQHGGWINVSSKAGEGTMFSVYLEMVEEKAVRKEGEPHQRLDLEGDGERILLVEDGSELSDFVARALTGNGYSVLSAQSAEEALDLFDMEDGDFHLVFSDVVLPGESGIELVEKLHSIKPGLPVLLSSGYTGEKSQWDIIRERGYSFLEKPYVLPELLKAVRAAMAREEAK